MSLHIARMTDDSADSVVRVSQLSFPEWNDSAEIISADQFRHYVHLYPQGQFVAYADDPDSGAGEIAVAYNTTFRTNHTIEGDWGYYYDFLGRGWWTHHEPEGEWLYGVDMGVIPAYRGKGIARLFYQARTELVQRENLRGEIIAGLLPGYPMHRGSMTVETYVERVTAGELFDPTLTVQLRNGFTLRRLLYGYIHDARSNNVSTLLVRANPDYRGM